MGKRKSKTAKQKQAKAKQKNGKKSSLGGVAVSKGMNSKFQQAKSSSVISVQMSSKNFGSAANGKKMITEASVRQKLKAKTKKVFMSTPSKAAEAPLGKNGKKAFQNDEQTEFRRQMASLQERQMAASQKNKSSSKSSGGSTLLFGFQEPTFSLQKTPQQLLQETTRQMETMTGVGQQGIGSFSSTPIRTNQSWAVAAATTKEELPLAHKNPFEALGGNQNDWDDDDDTNNDWRDEPPKNEQAASLFSMAPPTFSLLPRITPTPATSPHPNRFGEEEEELDPDL